MGATAGAAGPPRAIPGLEGIAAAETALSHVEGDSGRLILCGYELAEFAERHDFETAAALFWGVAEDRPPSSAADVRAALGAARVAAFSRFADLVPAFEGLTPSEGVRLGLASLPGRESGAHVAAAGAVPVFLANVVRLARGDRPIAPDPRAEHVADFFRMLRGAPADPKEVAALTTYLVTVMDHGMNASTFTARVIASTGAGLSWAALGAYAALTGPLHGGAPEPVLDMLDAIGTPERAAAWIETTLRNGKRLMGFGHRIYRVRDPRADVLKGALEQLAPSGEKLELARAVETAALDALRRHKPGRRLETNVEFYTAMLLDGLGMPRSAFTPLFAMGRVVGWTAHALEQRRTGRLIRPESIYVGRRPVEVS
ncbi:MAG TPA: citrate synthase [Gammaproteobacteria bacterium]